MRSDASPRLRRSRASRGSSPGAKPPSWSAARSRSTAVSPLKRPLRPSLRHQLLHHLRDDVEIGPHLIVDRRLDVRRDGRVIDVAANADEDIGRMHAPDKLDLARRRGLALEIGEAECAARLADDGEQELLVHAREKFLREGRIAQRRVPEAAIPARAVDLREVARIELEDALAQRAAAVRQQHTPASIPMGELDLLANAGDEVGAVAEIAGDHWLRYLHPM